jgi:uncharacterized protein (TIGR03067 family)
VVKIALLTASLGLAVRPTIAGGPGEPADLAAGMTGAWRVVRYSYNNRVLPTGDLTIYISGNKMTFVSKGNSGATGFKLDVSKCPAWFDLVDSSEGRRVYKGICMLDGDRLTLAYSTVGGDRPGRFGGGKMILMELARDGSQTTQPATTTTTAPTTRP